MSILDFHGRNQDKAVYVGVSAGSMMVTHSLHVNPEELKATGRYHDDEYNRVATSGYPILLSLTMARREARARKGSGAGSGQEGKGLPAALILLPFFEVSYCFPRCLKFVSQPASRPTSALLKRAAGSVRCFAGRLPHCCQLAR